MKSFEQKVAAFQLTLDLFAPYAENIGHFSEAVLERVAAGTELTDAQAARLLTRDLATIQHTLSAFAQSVALSKPQLHGMLREERIAEAILFVRNWPDSMWRIYENVLDDFSSPNNPTLPSPHDASRVAVNAIKAAFPLAPEAEDPLRGQDQLFINQLREHGNPWK